MEMSMERDCSALGSLFHQIINDMKNTSPLWEDFVAKASKLHACLRAAIQAIAAYLDAFQKIADAATNSRGASKEIGTALTRVCLRHKAVETRLKTFTAAIMDCLVQPLQDKLEDWKRSVATIDKEHAKEYKRCRTELKKRSTDTLRLQKKARKGQSDTLQSIMDSHMQDVTLRRAELEEVEKKSLRSAMLEERMRYCSFVQMLQPVVKEECEVMSELGHLQEAMQSIALVTKEPQILPAASEELIHDAKASITLYPESPSGNAGGGGGGSISQGGCSNSLGSRKSSVCSISSIISSGSSNSPAHPHYPRSLSQLISPSIRLKPGESSDSGFCSSPALTTQASSINNPSLAVTTWPTTLSQDTNVDLPSNASERPHTISSAYEKGHQRPPLTVYTFQNPETIHEGSSSVLNNSTGCSSSGQNTPSTQKSPAGALNRPPLPVRCSSLERPLAANSNNRGNSSNLMQRQCPSPIPAHITKELSAHLVQQQHQQQLQLQQQHLQQQQQQNYSQQPQLSSPPTYVNMSELANMAAMKVNSLQLEQQQQSPSTHQQQQQHMLQQQHSIDSISSIHSNDSALASMAQIHAQQQQQQHIQTTLPTHHQQQQYQHQQTTRSHSSTPSLHSHPSTDSTVATPPIGQTPSVSSGSSTPQNHYSPLLTNSPSSTAAGTPSGGSITSSVGLTTSGGCCAAGGGISGNNSDTSSGGNVVENDERSRASVLQKASMFEKQAAASIKCTSTPTALVSTGVTRTSAATNIDNSCTSIYGTRSINNYQLQQQQQAQPIDSQDVGSTRIARRSSVNTTKPPPPVRRSSSVTPSPNTPTTPTINTNLLHQQTHSLNTSTENLPPPPAYLLDARQTTSTTPPAGMPHSTQKVADTVKSLSGLRHQPASPHTLRRLQQQQQQQQLQQLSSPSPSQQQSTLQSPIHEQLYQQNIYSPPTTTPSSPISLPMHDEPEYDAYYNTYVEVQTFAANANFLTPIKVNSANVAQILKKPNTILSRLYQQPPKQYEHQYTKPSPELLSATTTNKRTTSPPSPYFSSLSSQQHDLDSDTRPPLPLPNPNPNLNPNQHHHHRYHHQHQPSLPLRYQQPLPTPPPPTTMGAPHSNKNNNKHMTQQQVQHHQHFHQQYRHFTEQPHQEYNNVEAIYGKNSPTSFRTSSPAGIYAQPKIVNNMSSFRTNSSGENVLQTSSATHSHVPAQPKTNPNLIAQLNARLSSKQQKSNEAIYGVTSANHHQQHHLQKEDIYMRNYHQQQEQQQQQQQMSPHASSYQQQQQQTYDAAEANDRATSNTNTNQNQSSSQYYASKQLTAATHQQLQNKQNLSKHSNATNNQRQQLLQSHSPMPPPNYHHQQQQHYTCPPPLEDPPPPPIHINNNSSATMPKRHHHSSQSSQQSSGNLATYTGASSASALSKNIIQQQQRLHHHQQQQQQGIYSTQQQSQLQQYLAPDAISSGHQSAQQYHSPQHISQRPPMPLPHQQHHQQTPQQLPSSTTSNKHKTAIVNAKQPPIPSRHSSVQQKIFVATNPFMQTTTIHCHSPSATSSVHSQPVSPICSSPTPSSVASIYGTSSRRNSGTGLGANAGINNSGLGIAHYDVGNVNSGGGGNGGGSSLYYNHQSNSAASTNYTTGTNIDKSAIIRSKAKAEFLENLNAKLAKQSLSGRAFAVRNLINSKALPDPRICHESLMDQIKRGATLKRNQKINDRSAPKIY